MMLVSSNIFALPDEIIIKILEDADYGAILACKRVRLVTIPAILCCNVLVSDMQTGVRYHIQIHHSTLFTGACR